MIGDRLLSRSYSEVTDKRCVVYLTLIFGDIIQVESVGESVDQDTNGEVKTKFVLMGGNFVENSLACLCWLLPRGSKHDSHIWVVYKHRCKFDFDGIIRDLELPIVRVGNEDLQPSEGSMTSTRWMVVVKGAFRTSFCSVEEKILYASNLLRMTATLVGPESPIADGEASQCYDIGAIRGAILEAVVRLFIYVANEKLETYCRGDPEAKLREFCKGTVESPLEGSFDCESQRVEIRTPSRGVLLIGKRIDETTEAVFDGENKGICSLLRNQLVPICDGDRQGRAEDRIQIKVRMFELANASTEFMDLMNRVCGAKLDGSVIVFTHDILIYSKIKGEHSKLWSEVLETLRKEKLYSKFSKCDSRLQDGPILRTLN
ncbi:hypothetical protein OSB04_002367 [Centaurea solstitialis]|uniref:Uncharacterized protein n=1 Tax=Centaurea solstitialis TaxID=347529 RepID=A0AA38U5D7_9ASTR|nr:hypothetical protein OSB04_002367 [Centaurea solstitialis]